MPNERRGASPSFQESAKEVTHEEEMREGADPTMRRWWVFIFRKLPPRPHSPARPPAARPRPLGLPSFLKMGSGDREEPRGRGAREGWTSFPPGLTPAATPQPSAAKGPSSAAPREGLAAVVTRPLGRCCPPWAGVCGAHAPRNRGTGSLRQRPGLQPAAGETGGLRRPAGSTIFPRGLCPSVRCSCSSDCGLRRKATQAVGGGPSLSA